MCSHPGDDVNWGCWHEACLAYLTAQTAARHSPDMEKRIVQAASTFGRLEAMYCT
jgi:hypothetical protein